MDMNELNKENATGQEKQNDQTPQSTSLNEDSGNMKNKVNSTGLETEVANEELVQNIDSEIVAGIEEEKQTDLEDTTTIVKDEKESEISEEEQTPEADQKTKEELVETNAESASGELIAKEENTEEEKAEKEDIKEPEKKNVEIPQDITVLNKEEIVNLLKDLLGSKKMLDIRHKVEEMKTIFYKKHKDEILSKKSEFIKSGGQEDEFEVTEDNTEIQFKELYKEYKELKTSENIALEKAKQDNLKLKYEIIEEIRDLVNRKESFNKTFSDFRELQNKWRDTGLVPQGELKNLWETYHHHVEKFYDYIKINKELRDLDLKKNLEIKIRLCERAEALLLETNIPKAFKELQELHNQYREVGPIPQDKKEEVWLRFKESTTIINRKHQEYYESLKEEQFKNLDAKKALCEKVEEISNVEYFKPKKWEEKTKEVIELQNLWRSIGYAPKRENNNVYKQFKSVCDIFFQNKRAFYEKNKEEQKNNLQLKTDLCMQAETLIESKDWKNTTRQLINLQKNWKQIGPVPRKYSDSVWNRFRTACDTFFKNKSEHFSGLDDQQEDNLKLKQNLIEKVKAFKPSKNNDENLKQLTEFQNEWTKIGFVPIKSKVEIHAIFREHINNHLENLDIDKNERIILKFKQRIDQMTSSNLMSKIEFERNKIITKMREVENEITLYENNIGFFAKSKNAEALVNDVKKKIHNSQDELDTLKEKLKIINQI